MRITVVGAGLAGATVAERLAQFGHDISVYDERNHVGGNVHTYRDPSTGVMVHAYGPHIFHTDDRAIWDYVNRFAKFEPYIQRTKALARGEVFSWPINLHTINQLYRKTLNPTEARKHLYERALHYELPAGSDLMSFQSVALAGLGAELYRTFLYGYTSKQWGVHPDQIPAWILSRLPMRLNYEDNAYTHKYQGIPRDGYTRMVETMLDHPRIEVHLGKKFTSAGYILGDQDFLFNSGPVDEWFDYPYGELPYRTLDFETIVDLSTDDYQGCSVMNACDLSTPWTRSTEHKHFTPWEDHTGTVVTREYSRAWQKGDIRYYPVHLVKGGDDKLKAYQKLAGCQREHMVFIGRLGTYQYLDMDKTISASIRYAEGFNASRIYT